MFVCRMSLGKKNATTSHNSGYEREANGIISVDFLYFFAGHIIILIKKGQFLLTAVRFWVHA